MSKSFMSSKNIIINVPTEKSSASKRPSNIIYDKARIKQALDSYVHIKNKTMRNLLVPGKTYMRYINKKDKGLRIGGFLKQVSDDAMILAKNGKTWPITLNDNTIYAKVSNLYENMEKASVLDHIFDMVQEKKLKIQIKDDSNKWKNTSWDDLMQDYCTKHY